MPNDALTLEECQVAGLNILRYFDKFCKDKNIRYYAAYGTLLGAVRHCGFIPWDDDIDLFMFRSEYNKFVELFSSVSQGQYKCVSFEKNTFCFPYSKIIDTTTRIENENVVHMEGTGLGIDIFPLDYVSDEVEDIPVIARSIILVKKMLRYSVYNNVKEVIGGGNSITKILLYIVSKALGTNYLRARCKKS